MDAPNDASPQDADDDSEPVVCPSPRLGGIREGTVEVRVRLSTALGLDDLPAQVPGWGTVLAGTARELLERYRNGEWRIVVTDDNGRLQRVLLARRRPRPPPRPPGPRRDTDRRGRGRQAIVELAAPATLLAALAPDDHGAWDGLLRELQRRLVEAVGSGGPPDRAATAEQAARRRLLAEVDRWVRVRDRQCVVPGCRRPAHAGDIDHTVDHARGGPSVSWNAGVYCRRHHLAKHEGGWRVTQPSPGRFHITTRAGARHVVEPPRILQPLPAPRPAPHPRPLPEREQHDGYDDDGFGLLDPAPY
ncbi:HNH endonuclease signature motif containing protein [Actinomycetospora cinnamomea]|uniref:HNH endonuclease signature motif containing protein n=1 Tax=Actinomycetospora cinnamomea TaxID=663609 RepID=UPI001FAEA405|nr:HNH endonuclease signature motif containing protein [Actinomycetospora cinnamomea]